MKVEGPDREILDLLASCSDEAIGHGAGWMRPMDLGGRDGSHHSATLGRLVRMGMAERKQRSAYPDRGSYVYRITERGRAELTGPVFEFRLSQPQRRTLEHAAELGGDGSEAIRAGLSRHVRHLRATRDEVVTIREALRCQLGDGIRGPQIITARVLIGKLGRMVP